MQDNTWQAVLQYADDLIVTRGQQYNTGPVVRQDYWIFGNKSLLTMVHLKVLRIIAEMSDKTITKEDALELFADLINYIRFTWEDGDYTTDSLDARKVEIAERIKTLPHMPEPL